MIHIVDDEPNVLFLMGEALRRRGYEVATFSRPEEYLAEVRERPELLITDLLMAGVDGVGFCEALRSNTSMRSVPLVVCTGLVLRDGRFSDESLKDRFGVQAIITKPFALSLLFDSVQRILGTKAAATRESVQLPPQPRGKALAAIPLKQVVVAPTAGNRIDPRYNAAFEVSFPNEEALSLEYTENISRGGLFVRATQSPPLGTEVTLTLRVPWETQGIALKVIVAHVVAPGDGVTAGFGCRLAQADRMALDIWHSVVTRVADQVAQRARGPRVLLLGFSGERVADLMQKAGVLCRADLRIVPLASWQSVLREAEKSAQTDKLIVIDVGSADADARLKLFDSRMLRELANVPNVSLAYVGLNSADENNLPTELHVIKAGALTSADLVGAIVSWVGLPERAHLRVRAAGTASISMKDRLVAAELLDVSRAGARALTSDPLKPGDRVSLTFMLGARGGVDDLLTEVRWAKPEGRGKWMCGMSFVDQRADVLDRVAQYVEEQARFMQNLESLKR